MFDDNGSFLLAMLEFFIFFAWFMSLFWVFGDLFRSKDLGGVAKTLWTLFLIVPGLALLVAAAFLEDRTALIAAIAGAVVTAVGALLLYQDLTAHYESWSYAWALIPGSVGVALAVHGLRFHRADLVSVGTKMVAAFGLLLLVGAWFFETIFRTNRAPFDLGDNWPIALIALGGVLFVVGLLRGSTGGGSDETA